MSEPVSTAMIISTIATIVGISLVLVIVIKIMAKSRQKKKV